jgi:hypothetical protein
MIPFISSEYMHPHRLVLVEAPAPSPGEQKLFWYAALRSTATRSKITDDRKKKSPPGWTAFHPLHHTEPAAYPHGVRQSYQKVPLEIFMPILFAFLIMIPISTDIENLIHPAQLREDECLSEDGLIYCSKCRTPWQKRINAVGRTIEPRCM